MVACLTHEGGVEERGGWGVVRRGGGGSKLRRGGYEGCFVYMSWLVGAFDFVIVVSSWKIESYELCVILTATLEVCPLENHTDKWHDI